MKRIAVFGGTFDPVHVGHLKIARALIAQFELDRFVFLPAFHAPHKPERKPTSAFHRYAMLSIATLNDPTMVVSTLELEKQAARYTIESLPELQALYREAKLFFVMGADSWMDINTWMRWEEVLLMTDHIVVTRPGYEIGFGHVPEEIRDRIVDIRRRTSGKVTEFERDERSIYITDAVTYEASASELRRDLSDGELKQIGDLQTEVAKYIEKYELYT